MSFLGDQKDNWQAFLHPLTLRITSVLAETMHLLLLSSWGLAWAHESCWLNGCRCVAQLLEGVPAVAACQKGVDLLEHDALQVSQTSMLMRPFKLSMLEPSTATVVLCSRPKRQLEA